MPELKIFILSIFVSLTCFDDSVSESYEDKEMAAKNNEFALEIMKQTQHSTNQIFSPYSIFSALAMLSLGTRGNTLYQLQRALRLPQDEKAIKRAYETFLKMNLEMLPENNSNLTVAMKIFADESTIFLKKFLDETFQYFGASVEKLNFLNNPEGSADSINKWVSNLTDGNVQEIVTGSDIDPNTSLFLVDVINFKGRWKYEFNPNLTKEADFWSSEYKHKRVPMMRLEKAKLNYAIVEALSCTALELPFKEDATSMVILIPYSVDVPLNEIKKNLSIEILTSINFEVEEVMLIMPKFRLESSYQLNDILKRLNVEDLFVPGESDMSGIDGSRNLYVSKALHKAVIDVNEEGSEASAATSISVKARKAMNLFVNIDHPFLFFIRDNKSRLILFSGQVVDPQV